MGFPSPAPVLTLRVKEQKIVLRESFSVSMHPTIKSLTVELNYRQWKEKPISMKYEDISDRNYVELTTDQQTAIIRRYCEEIEARIRTASSDSEAGRIALTICERFEDECSSTLLRSGLLKRAREIVDRYWQSRDPKKGH